MCIRDRGLYSLRPWWAPSAPPLAWRPTRPRTSLTSRTGPAQQVRMSIRQPKPKCFEDYITYLCLEGSDLDNEPMNVEDALSTPDEEKWWDRRLKKNCNLLRTTKSEILLTCLLKVPLCSVSGCSKEKVIVKIMCDSAPELYPKAGTALILMKVFLL